MMMGPAASAGEDRGRSQELVAAGFARLVAACSAPTASYEDPLSQIGRGVSSATANQFKSLTLGVIFTDNTKKAMGVATGTQKMISSFGVFTNQSALADVDPTFLTSAIDETLRRRFKDLLVLERQRL